MAYFYNGNPILAPLTITSNRMAFQVETLSLKQTTFLTDAQRWELSFGIASNGNEAETFLAHTQNFFQKKSMIMPQLIGPSRAITYNGSLSVASTAIAGASLVPVAASSFGLIPAGYFISFSNHDKVYAVTANRTFNSNTANLTIFPKLVQTVSSGVTVRIREQTTFRYQLDMTSSQGIGFSDGLISSVGTINLIEAL